MSTSFFHPIGELFRDEEVRAVFLVDDKSLFFPEPESLEQGTLQKIENLAGDDSKIEKPSALSQDHPTATRKDIEQYLTSLYSKAAESEVQADWEILSSFTLDKFDEGEFSLVYDPKKATQNKKLVGLQSLYGIATRREISGRVRSLIPEWTSAQPLGQISARIQIKDLTPWADKVLEKIERNWMIDQARSQGITGTVRISVTIAKSGEITFIEVTKSSGNQTLDSSAKSAVEMSVPIPSLPIMYPSKSIVIKIEFEY